MLICSVKASALKFTGALLLFSLLLGGLLAFAVPTVTASATASEYHYSGVGSEEGRQAFFKQFGWEVSDAPIDTAEFTLPEEFDRVLLGYNELQKAQGLDLSRYRKKTVTRYIYEIENYASYEGSVYISIIVYRGRVIGGDVASADPEGFVHGFVREEG